MTGAGFGADEAVDIYIGDAAEAGELRAGVGNPAWAARARSSPSRDKVPGARASQPARSPSSCRKERQTCPTSKSVPRPSS